MLNMHDTVKRTGSILKVVDLNSTNLRSFFDAWFSSVYVLRLYFRSFESVQLDLVLARQWESTCNVLVFVSRRLRAYTVCAECQDDNWCCLEVEWLVSSCWRLFCCSFWVNRLYRRTTWVSLFLIFFANLCWKFSVKYNDIKLTKITKCEVWNVIIQMYCTCKALNTATNAEFYISILYSF